MAIIKNRAVRAFIFIVGCCSIVVGTVGIFLPLLPTTPFVLLSAWCFLKSSDSAHRWIYRQPILGDALRNWEKKRVISRSTKRLAIGMILVSGILIWLRVQVLWIKISVTILLLVVSTFIVMQNEES